MSWNPVGALSQQAQRVPPFFFERPPGPIIFNFDQGLPAHETFPLEDLRRIACDVLESDGGWALEYITFVPDQDGNGFDTDYPEMVLGNRDLRQQIANWIVSTNTRPDLNADNVILTTGAVQAIALAATAFVDSGDGVLIEEITFPYAQRYFTMSGAHVGTVPVDASGLDVDAVEARLSEMSSQGVRPKLLYTIPTFHLPTGVCLTLERRRRLLELADEWDLCVIEDAIYADLRYDGVPLPSLLSLDTSGRVIQVHSFSKVIAPGVRLGWATGGVDAVDCLARVRTDLGVSQWLARIMARFMSEGLLEPHIARANQIYRERRNLAAHCLREGLGDSVRFDLPNGGFYLWVELLADVDWGRVRAEASRAGVIGRPGEAFGVTDGRKFLRIAFSHTSPSNIERGLSRLATIVNEL